MRSRISFGSLILTAIFFGIFSTTSAQSATVLGNEDALANGGMSVDLDGDKIPEALAIVGGDLYVFKREAGQWARKSMVVTGIHDIFDAKLPTIVIGKFRPNDSMPYEIAIRANSLESHVVTFKNPMYRQRLPRRTWATRLAMNSA